MDTPSSLKPLLDRWAALSGRERVLLKAAAAAMALLLVWSMAVRPAWTTLREAPQRRAELGARLEKLQAWAAEAATLRGAASAQAAAAAAGAGTSAARGPQAGIDEALRAELLAQLGESARIEAQGRQIVIAFDAVSGGQVRAALSVLRARLQARLLDAELVPGPDGLRGRLRLEWQPT